MADIGTTINNSRTINLSGGAKVVVPRVALAYSCATLQFEDATAGVYMSVTCGGVTIKLIIATDGTARMSLTPFMTKQLKSNLDNPLPTANAQAQMTDKWRGFLELTINDGTTTYEVIVPFIYGGFNPYRYQNVKNIDFIANGKGTWTSLDLASWYDNNGEITDVTNWQKNNFNLNNYFNPAPDGDDVRTLACALFYGEKIYITNLTLNLRYDCRADNVMQVKWLDAEGGINSRLFTFAGQSEGGATESSYTRHHWNKTADSANDGYWQGADKWAQRVATKQITLGDDNIALKQFQWIASLVKSSCVEVYANGIWQRCNLVDSAVECNPRKNTFTATITLEMSPINQPQQF